MKKKTATENIHKLTRQIPNWTLAIVCLAIVFWLTLSPHPLGDTQFDYFFGIDKVAHVIMFMGLTLCLLFDAMRAKNWHKLSLVVISFWSILSMFIGFGTEYFQYAMNVGRQFEVPDMTADAFGSIVGGVLWIFIGHFLCLTENEIKQKRLMDLHGTSDLKES